MTPPPAARPSRARPKLLFLVWVPTFSLALNLILRDRPSLSACLWTLIYSEIAAALCYGFVHLFEAVERRLHRRRGTVPPRRALTGTLFVAAMGLIPAIYVTDALERVLAPAAGLAYTPSDARGYLQSGLIGLVLLGGYFLMQVKETELQAERAEREKLAAQLASLTAQMPPHFLHNSLNAIASLVHDAPQAAEDAIVALAELAAGALRAAKGDAHALRAELDLCRAYLALEKARFGDKLAFSIDAAADAPLDVRVPVLLLQTLLENAVRHGHGNAPENARLAVRVRRAPDGRAVAVEIEDDGRGFPARSGAAPAAGTGLENSRRRLRLLFGEGAAALAIAPATPRGTIVTVTLPLPAEPPP